jgi:hypothetical protein
MRSQKTGEMRGAVPSMFSVFLLYVKYPGTTNSANDSQSRSIHTPKKGRLLSKTLGMLNNAVNSATLTANVETASSG